MKPYYVVQHMHDIYGWLDLTEQNNHLTEKVAIINKLFHESHQKNKKFRIIKRTDEVVRTKKGKAK